MEGLVDGRGLRNEVRHELDLGLILVQRRVTTQTAHTRTRTDVDETVVTQLPVLLSSFLGSTPEVRFDTGNVEVITLTKIF